MIENKIFNKGLLILCAVLFFQCKKNQDKVNPDIGAISALKIPEFRIVTDGRKDITDKYNYINAQVQIKGGADFKDYQGKTQIRGRGNTTWSFAKKPFRIQLQNSTPLFGLAAEKSWLLIANYLDGSLMLNATAFKLAELFQMPYTNHAIPVDFFLNDQYQGSYIVTEQIEIDDSRINIGKDGLLLSLDTAIDKDDQYFFSNSIQLPVQIKHPEITDKSQIAPIAAEFNNLEQKAMAADFPNNNFLEYFDSEAAANYFLVYALTDNEEINHPKSTYLYKSKAGKFALGPVWDFDWAFGFEGTQRYYSNTTINLFWSNNAKGTRFFKKIYTHPQIKTLIKAKWQKFRANDFENLLKFIDVYSAKIVESRTRDYQLWRRGNENFELEISNLKNYLVKRAIYVDNLVQDF